MTLRNRHLLVLPALAVALAGCQDPYQHEQPNAPNGGRPAHAQTLRGDAEPAGPSPAPAALGPIVSRAHAREVAAAFAHGWSNWDWRTAAAEQRKLAHLAAGPLAQQLRSGARRTTSDESLVRDRPGSRGSVVAIDLRRDGRGAAGVVVTREQTYTGGHADLGGQRYRVYLTTIQHRPSGWRVTRWEPQP